MYSESQILWALQALTGALGAVLWVSFRDVKKQSDDLKNDMTNYKLYVAENFATVSDIANMQASTKDMFKEMLRKLDNLELNIRHISDNFRDRLEGKQDKHKD